MLGVGTIGRVDILDPTELAVDELHHQPGNLQRIEEAGDRIEEAIALDEVDEMLGVASRHRDDPRILPRPSMDDDVTGPANRVARIACSAFGFE
ncbi:hypothetical protein GCM10009691_33400 [Brevibacterium picturae]|uniref:Uncharacterized protein n=1 Tax=Brevibacterium picturae TaxID=260553 RepID=A0ABN2CCK6_9MICO